MDTKQIKSLMNDFDKSTLSRMQIATKDGFSIKLEKNTGLVTAPVQPVAPLVATPVATQTVAPVASAKIPSKMLAGDAILSPMVGTYYSSPSPDSPEFAKVGDTVKKGQVIAILEAMKIMNELEAEFDCKILEVLAKNAQAVEYDMPLFIVKKI